jgi:hypothetical protein
VFRQSKLNHVGLSCRQPAGETARQIPQQRHSNPNLKVFTHTPSGKNLSINDIWLLAQKHSDVYETVPADGTKVEHVLTLNVEEGVLSFPTPDGPRSVAQIRLRLELCHEMEEIPISPESLTTYSSPDDEPIQRTEFRTTLQNLDITMAMQAPKGSREVLFEFTLAKKGPIKTP